MTHRHTLTLLTVVSIATLARADDAADAKAAATAAIKAIMDNDQAAITSHVADPADAEAAKGMSGLFTAQAAMTAAAKQKFGDAKEAAGMMDPSKALERFTKMDAVVTGDTAGMRAPGSSRDEITLKKVGGEWKVASLFGRPEAREQVKSMTPKMIAALDTTRSEIEAGKYATFAQASAALQQKVMAAAMQSMPATRPATRQM